MSPDGKRIGFVSTRLAGTDGVSLETLKWVRVLESMGHTSFCFAGESDWPEDRRFVVPEAHFDHPDIRKLNHDLFNDYVRSATTSLLIENYKNLLKERLYAFIKHFDINLLIIENALAIPMNIPLGLALTELIAETSMPTIAHHHDFSWERTRFAVNAAEDYLRAAFPPTLRSIRHVVINSYGQSQLALRTGASALIIPNVMDFDAPPPPADGYANSIRADLGLADDEYMILQPTRVVARKRIERAVMLSKRLELPNTIIISHGSGDEGSEYADFLREYIELLDVKVRFSDDIIAYQRGQTEDGRKIYSLADAYRACDLVTYPSSLEGFGNAFLEAIYYQRPLVMSTYEIYRIDIKPKGFQVIEFGDYITEDTVKKTRELLIHPEIAKVTCDLNYRIASRYYSFANLERLLAAVIHLSIGE
jgi:glycosyltransferase involved in cell wall biosynthesis